jgi:hypothetical protein
MSSARRLSSQRFASRMINPRLAGVPEATPHPEVHAGVEDMRTGVRKLSFFAGLLSILYSSLVGPSVKQDSVCT